MHILLCKLIFFRNLNLKNKSAKKGYIKRLIYREKKREKKDQKKLIKN